ncbi:hypothetical protein GCM10011344_20880 [Dokdonia pacifica]|uniref:HD domain-containing protein n=1 Tax=Dokdonia pacifica TaxID=1627892 RepID=A0A238VNX8_9FLAO|nr:HD domain-containing protein [Dokdonia pacifica]GGG20062.1 hypothetical protein GCM10011344_20880 [Dokdonia pacifica]SNR35463.1 HD domain-containing protein [Dokdonia pacifica]
MNTHIILSVKKHCKKLIKESRCNELAFHNWKHTKNVVLEASRIGAKEGLKSADIEMLVIAAYFHDTGNAKANKDHEMISCYYAKTFLDKNKYHENRINTIINLIKATQMPQTPTTLLQKILCDADLSHLGKKEYIKANLDLRNEWSTHCNMSFTDEQWLDLNIAFLENHKWHSQAALMFFEKQKVENIRNMKSVFV